jgi:toxin CptA
LSIASSSCRIDWRPSPRLCLALLALGGLAAGCVLGSGLPAWGRALLAPAALAHGAWLARREWRREPCVFEFDPDGGVLMEQGGRTAAICGPRVRVRGSLAALSWRGDSRVWCGDTLPDASRRQLLLRSPGQSPA